MIQSSKKIELHRNSGIDVLRGLCIFGVLWHHSCLYLGTNFLPMYMKQLSFLLEVPAIFFVSGMTMRFINRDMIVNGIFKLSLSFTLAYLLLSGFGFFGNITNFWQPLFFQALPLPKFFSVLDGSYWFVPIYVMVIICARVILEKVYPLYPFIMIGCFAIYVLTFFDVFSLQYFSINFSNAWGKGFFFLLSVFLLGYWWMAHENFQKKKWGWVLGFLITLCILYICMYASSGTKIFNLWHWKDMKALPYMTASMFSIIGFMCIYKPDLKNRVLERVGRYSLFYFIGQGISTSLVRTMANYFNIWWGGRIIIFFVINIAVWFICSEIFLFIYRSIGRIYKRLILLAKK